MNGIDRPGDGAPAAGRGRHRADRLAARDRWAALAVLLVAGFMDLVDVTIVYVALPAIQRDLHTTYVDMEWIVSAYVLGFAALLIIGGRLGDRVGRRRVLLIGLAGFTAASLACGLAAGPATLIAARWVQGSMAGLMIPQILSIIHVTFAGRERAKALAIWGGVLGGASVAGVILGGILVQYDLFGWAWRPIFLVNVPIGLLVIPLAARLVSESRSDNASRLDPVGMALAVGAVLLLTYPLTVGRSLGWPSWTFLLMIASAVVLAVFVGHQRRRARLVGSPLVVLELFGIGSFSLGMAVWALFWIVSGGFFLAWTLYLQTGLAWTPLRAGLTAAAFSIGAAVAAGLSMEVLVPRYGRRVLSVGAVMNIVGFGAYLWATMHFGPSITSAQMILPLLVTGLGFGFLVAPMVDLILSDVPIRDAGSASGLLSTTQQVGTALGVALAAMVFFTQLAEGSGQAVRAVTPTLAQQLSEAGIGGEPQHAVLTGFGRCIEDRASETDPSVLPTSCHLAADRPDAPGGPLSPLLTAAASRAAGYGFSHAFATTLGCGIALLLLVFVGTFGLPPQMRAPSSIPSTRQGRRSQRSRS
jgi:EmrB/QacA subfamily drug resistance transporter